MACALPLPPEAAAQHASGQTLCGECLRAPPPWTRCDAAVDYAFPWDRLVSRFKFGDRPDLARPLADLLIDALPPRPANAAPLLVTAVPLSDARLAERGYNQAWVLAQRLARARRWPAVPDLLLRCRDTPHQVGLGREARARNLRQALLANPARVGQIAGREILVVDDVMTTGMTARAVALALHEAGAAAVHLAVVARTLPGQSRSA